MIGGSPIEFLSALGQQLNRKVPLGPLERLESQLLSEIVVLKQCHDGFGQFRWRRRLHEQSAALVLDHFGDASSPAADYRLAPAHRFNVDEAERFVK